MRGKALFAFACLAVILCLTGCSKDSEHPASPETSSPENDCEVLQENQLVLSNIISKDALSVMINAYGQTVTLDDTEISEFFEIIKGVTYSQANANEDITTPGAIVITVTIEYSPEKSSQITLPYYLHEGVLFSAGTDSITLFNGFFEEPF